MTATASGSTAHAAADVPAAPRQAAATASQQAAADSSSGNTVYVDNSTSDGHGSNCSDTASDAGGEAQPFCTIDAAASAALPGDTVMVEPGTYGATTISVSGIPGDPITFQGATQGIATVNGDASTPAFTISGAHYVTLNGFTAGGDDGAYEVNGLSSNVTINGGSTSADSAYSHPNIQIDAADHVTVSRVSTSGRIQVNQGATNAVITGNTITSGIGVTTNSNGAATDPAVNIAGAPGTEVVGNTIAARCTSSVSLTNGSNLAEIENNIFYPMDEEYEPICAGHSGSIPIVVVSSDSTSGTTTGYNIFDDVSLEHYSTYTTTTYLWGSYQYGDPGYFNSQTNEGQGDIEERIFPSANVYSVPTESSATVPGFGQSTWYTIPDIAVDSANSDAPGELARDQLEQPHADEPEAGNTGANTGTGTYDYFDRGAVEVNRVSESTPTVTSSGPMTATVSFSAPQAYEGVVPTNVPAIMADIIDFKDGSFPIVDITNSALTYQHTYQTAGAHPVTLTEALSGVNSQNTQAVVGADYSAVTPSRVMDTRNGTGVAKGAVSGNGTVTLPVSKMPGVPSNATAVVLNLTETGATSSGYITAYPGNGTAPLASNINYAKGTTIPNQVTVPVSDGEVSFKNGSGGTVQLVADLSGYYSASGSGYAPQAPTRVLDTRNGTGAAKAAIRANSKIQLNLTGKVPADATSVTLNVTETAPQSTGWLAVYPDSSTTPTTSSLNFTSGQTGANLVTVPLNNGIADIYNGSGGTVQVVADLAGYYGPSATDTYVPYGPDRIIDTRTSGNSPIAAGGTLAVATDADTGATPVAAVDNITATKPTSSGYLTAYPEGTTRPVSSNLNFSSGATVQNLSVTQASPKVDVYNGSGGTVHVIVDEDGYFIANQ